MNPLSSLQHELDDGLQRLGLADAGIAPCLLDYLALLDRWNQSFNLTAIRNPREMLVKHVFDSLAIHPHVHDERMADLGAGAGLPGIVLAIARPGLSVTLVESAGKKVRFMREAKRKLGLENIEIVEGRAEALKRPGGFDCLVARALGTLGMILEVGGHLLTPQGRLLAMKGTIPHDEIAALPAGWVVGAVHALDVPGLDAERHLVVVQREPINQAAGSRMEQS